MKAVQQQLKEHPFVTLVGVVVLFGISGYLLLGPSKQQVSPHASQWYYDLETGAYLAFDSQGRSSPLTLPSGHKGVLAHMFICEGDEPDKKFIGYLEIEIPASAKPPVHGRPDSGSLTRIALPPAKNKSLKWIDTQSAAATRIFNRINQSCSPRKCIEYLPGPTASNNP